MKWFKSKEVLPPEDEHVLLWDESMGISEYCIGYWDSKIGWMEISQDDCYPIPVFIEHWAHIEPPEVDQ